MIIAGAGGHAQEIYCILSESQGSEELFFFDDFAKSEKTRVLFDKEVIQSEVKLIEAFRNDPRFILSTGNPHLREKMSLRLESLGGNLESVVSNTVKVSSQNVKLGAGLNIMMNVVIYNDVAIGKGSLINTACSLHHGASIGDFCEICPGARILGNVQIGDRSFVGSNVVILPGLKIGEGVKIGAGAVVMENVPDNQTWVGVPAHRSK